MLGAIFMALLGVSLAVAAVALVVWVLRQLWGHDEEKAPVEAIEIKAEPPEAEPEAEEAVEEAGVETDAGEIEAPEAEVEGEAPVPEPEAPAEEAETEVEPEAPDVEEEEEAPAPEPAAQVEEAEVEAEPAVPEALETEEKASEPEAEAEEVAVPAKRDDLKRIEGIGPKIASVLQAGGISTYAQLANSDPDQLRQILEDSDPRLVRIANPDTWPEQASFAAAGDWDGFDALNRELKDGKRA